MNMQHHTWTDDADWVWTPDYDDTKDPGRFVLFRNSFEVEEKPVGEFKVRVSADTRYRLFVNGTSVAFGPCKGFPASWHYETVDIANHLVKGENVLSAKVLRYSYLHAGNSSMSRAATPGFFLHSDVDGLLINTGRGIWMSKIDESIDLLPASEWSLALGPPFLNINERVHGNKAENGWELPGFDHSLWVRATGFPAKAKMLPIKDPRRLTERPIPLLPEIRRSFQSAVQCKGIIKLGQWDSFLKENQPLHLPENTRVTVELQAHVLTTGFLELECAGGVGTTIEILCSEAYERDFGELARAKPFTKRVKGKRSDYTNGKLYGPSDVYSIGANTSYIEPFWFRTFRYLRLEIATSTKPIELKRFQYRETHYPLEITTTVESPVQLYSDLWRISLATLRNCMHETYEDNPYYEQNQFEMDARLEILFTYQLSRDDRLARKCMEDFFASRRLDGLLEAHFPVAFSMMNIPQFSLYWILMVYDHMQYFGDGRLVKKYISAVDGILNYFDTHLNSDGLVGRFPHETWPFIDWVSEWHGSGDIRNMGIPKAYWGGAATFNSLLYAMTLNHSAELCDSIGRKDTALEYRERALQLNDAVTKHCWDGNFFLDGPGDDGKSQHSQIFAVLSGASTGESAVELMRRTFTTPNLPICSYSMSFYVFRAVEKAGLYEELFPELIKPWERMIANDLTTWAEDDVMFRSDCQGWSCLPIYEIVTQIFGLTPPKAGDSTVTIKPRPTLLASATGNFATALGTISISWNQSDGVMIGSSADINVDLTLNNNTSSRMVHEGEIWQTAGCIRRAISTAYRAEGVFVRGSI